MGRCEKEGWKEVLLSSPRQKHVAVGNLNIDISVEVPHYPHPDTTIFANRAWIGPGGAATNYAVAIARLGFESLLVARTGEDAIRLGVIEELSKYGVDTRFVQVAKGESPGMVVVIVSPMDSSRTMISMRGANLGLSGTLIPREGDLVHFASTPPRIINEALTKIDGIITYDPGSEVFRETEGMIDIFKEINVLFLNQKEAERITKGSSPRGLLRGNLDTVVIKLGKGGAIAYTREETCKIKPIIIHKPVDVTGAGDAFDAGYNVCMISGCTIGQSLFFASLTGAAKTLKRGSSNMPTLTEVIELVNDYNS